MRSLLTERPWRIESQGDNFGMASIAPVQTRERGSDVVCIVLQRIRL